MTLPLLARADGDLIYDFGADSSDRAIRVVEGPAGRLYVATRFDNAFGLTGTQYRLLAVESDGRAVTGFGTDGRIELTNEARALAVRPDGSVVAGWDIIESFSNTGAPLTSVDPCGSGCPFIYDFLLRPDGSVWFGGTRWDFRMNTVGWSVGRIAASGVLDTTFSGTGISNIDGSPSTDLMTMRWLPGGKFVAYGTNDNHTASALVRFNADGMPDFADFGTNGVLALPATAPFGSRGGSDLAVDGSERMLVPGGTSVIKRLDANGAIDAAYTEIPLATNTTYWGFSIDSLDRAVVYGVQGSKVYVARLAANGGLDNSFGVGGQALVSPNVANVAGVLFVSGIVDSANRPVLLVTFQRTDFGIDVALLRLTAAGALDATFGAGVADDDAYPDPFSIAAKSAVAGTSTVVSNPVVLAGFNVPTRVSSTKDGINNAGVSVGCGQFYVTTDTIIHPGESLCVRLAAPETAGASFSTTVTVGRQKATYTVTALAGAADIAPEPFAFTNQSGAAVNTEVISAPVTIEGITGFAPVSVSGGAYSIGCQPPYAESNGFITDGQTVCLRVTTPAAYGTSVTATLAINGVTGSFTVSTLPVDTTPEAFAFTSQSSLAPGSVATSNIITVMGVNTPAPISVANGEYSLDCNGTFATASATVQPTQAVCVRHTVGAAGTVSMTTLTIGGVSGTFRTTALQTSSATSPPPSSGGGGALGIELLCLGLLAALRALVAQGGRGTVLANTY